MSKYLPRFAFGAGIALVAGLVGMKFGPVIGGIFLGFPAVLPASLTLIQKDAGKEDAAIDALGASLGAVAMVAYAVLIVFAIRSWGVIPTIAAALVLWLGVALSLYAAASRFLPRSRPAPSGYGTRHRGRRDGKYGNRSSHEGPG
jgi:Protein of unknown function (DUF3147)